MKKKGIFLVAVFLTGIAVGSFADDLSDLKNAANKGDAEAQSNLDTEYINAQDFKQAVFWFKKSAEQGFAQGQYNLGLCYMKGYGVDQSWHLAFSWFKKAAEQGLAAAQRNVATLYMSGDGVPKDAKQAEFWFRKAAEQGDVKAQFALELYFRK